MGLEKAAVIAFVATTDAARAKAFYQDVLGLHLVSDEQFALVFEANGTMLRVQKVHEVKPVPYTALGWKVPDIEEAIRLLAARGVSMARFEGVPQDGVGIWTASDGTRVA